MSTREERSKKQSKRERRICVGLVLVWLVLAVAAPAWATAWRVYFSPEGGATEAVVRALSQARQSVFVLAYSFTSAPIAKALVEAHKRGVQVEAVLEKNNRSEKYSAADFLLHAGIPTYIDAAHAIQHNKVMVIDERVVITGSFNFTKAAEHSNAENLLVIEDRELAAQYLANWRLHASHSERYEARAGAQSRGRPRAESRRGGEDFLKRLFRMVFENSDKGK